MLFLANKNISSIVIRSSQLCLVESGDKRAKKKSRFFPGMSNTKMIQIYSALKHQEYGMYLHPKYLNNKY